MPIDTVTPEPRAPDYPVVVDAALDRPSRALWLVKWLLLIPHYLVLALLAIGAAVVWIIAFFAILFTGRYPRPLFDYTVGVMRWAWRVSAYGYGLAATDRYPPFTLADVPDYPAHLEVAYPEQLSRGLVLVKWWLLAIPHYVVTGLFFAGALRFGTSGTADTGGTGATGGAGDVASSGPGLVGALVLVALVVLLVRGRYLPSVFDFVVGLQRWGYRVGAYALLLTDRYPPFRLDLGGDDPGTPRPPVASSGPAHALLTEPVAPPGPPVR